MFIAEQLESISHSDASNHSVGTDFFLPGEVERVLRSTGYSCLRDIEISVHHEVVFLRGRVPSFHMKQVAQTAARSVSGVGEVCNELNVVCSRWSGIRGVSPTDSRQVCDPFTFENGDSTCL